MWQRVGLTAAVLLGLVGTAEAADKDGRFKIEGAGALSCPRFNEIKAKRGDEYRFVLSWIDGYLTAANEFSSDTFDILSWQSSELVGAMIEGFCQQNQEANVVAAVGQLVKALAAERVRSLPEVVTAEANGRKVSLYKPVMRTVQERLIRAGHLKGSADGVYGPGTRGALEAFQKAQNLEVTGLPDQRTLVQLFYTPAGGGVAPGAPRQQQQPQQGSGGGGVSSSSRAPAPSTAPEVGGGAPLDLRLGPAPAQ